LNQKFLVNLPYLLFVLLECFNALTIDFTVDYLLNVLKANDEGDPVVFEKYEYGECYTYGILGSIMFERDGETAKGTVYATTDCSLVGVPFSIEIDEEDTYLGYKSSIVAPFHIAFYSVSETKDGECQAMENGYRTYYTSSAFREGENYYQYYVAETAEKSGDDAAEYLWLGSCENSDCKKYTTSIKAFTTKCHECSAGVGIYLECGASSIFILLAIALLLFFF